MTGRRVALAVVLIVLLAGAFAIGRWSAPAALVLSQSAVDDAPPPVLVSAEMRVLKDAADVFASVNYSTVTTVALRGVDGSGIVTHQGLASGAVVESGAVVIEIDGRPLIALPGAVPAYRDIPATGPGRDVSELIGALSDLGFEVAGQEMTAEARAAVATLYQRLGYAPPERDGVAIPRSEVLFVPSLPAIVQGTLPGVGNAPPTTMSFGSGPLRLSIEVPAGVGPVAQGDAVSVNCEGSTMHGTVAAEPVPLAISGGPDQTVADPGNGGAPATFTAPVDTSTPLTATLIGSRCLATVEALRTEGPVLAAPVTALYTAADGRVTVRPADGAPLEVSVGVVAGGWAEIADPGQHIVAGTKLKVSG